jgi:hypothetical protein
MLELSPDKVAYVILKAKEYDTKVGTWDDSWDGGDAVENPEAVLEDFGADASTSEIRAFIGGLNEDEQADLVALAWIGRGTYTAEQFDEAVATARAERNTPTETYLLGIPLLGDYLSEGLEQMGISPGAAEEALLGYVENEVASES